MVTWVNLLAGFVKMQMCFLGSGVEAKVPRAPGSAAVAAGHRVACPTDLGSELSKCVFFLVTCGVYKLQHATLPHTPREQLQHSPAVVFLHRSLCSGALY